jgi:hypothetical protein
MYRTRLFSSAGPSGADVLAGGPRAAAGADCVSADCFVRLLGGVLVSGRMGAAAFLLPVAFRDTMSSSAPLCPHRCQLAGELCADCVLVCESNIKAENGAEQQNINNMHQQIARYLFMHTPRSY